MLPVINIKIKFKLFYNQKAFNCLKLIEVSKLVDKILLKQCPFKFLALPVLQKTDLKGETIPRRSTFPTGFEMSKFNFLNKI